MMNLDRMLANAALLQNISAPTFHEHARAQRLQKCLHDAGVADTAFDTVGNVIATLSHGCSPPLIISAHLDTVFDSETPLTLINNTERLSGPGIGDNSISLAALVELAHDLLANPADHEVILVGNVAEEGLGNLTGMKSLVDRYKDEVLAYLVLEGFSQNTLVNRGLAIQRFRITVLTQGGHPWAHPDLPSAIHILTNVAQYILNWRRTNRSRTTINIGKMQGGSSINTIAADARMEIDARSTNPQLLDRFESYLKRICRRHEISGTEIRVESIGARPAGLIPDTHPLVQAAQECLREAGISPIRLAIGSTDANIPLSRGYPAICMGLTRGGNAHSLEEYIEIEPLERGYAALLNLVYKLAQAKQP